MKSMNETLKKAMSTMFAPVDNVKYDLATGQTGIITDGGLVTLGSDGAQFYSAPVGVEDAVQTLTERFQIWNDGRLSGTGKHNESLVPGADSHTP